MYGTYPHNELLDTDAASKVLLLDCNIPPQNMGVSSAELLFDHPLSDYIPKLIRIREEWLELADRREMAHVNRQRKANIYGLRELQLLIPGETFSIQNQRGIYPCHWNATETVANSLHRRQYKIIVDGNRRVTL